MDTTSERIQLLSIGGGRQSAGVVALIAQGLLPKPDAAAMAALEWERRETYRYVNKFIRPLLVSMGIPFTYVSRKKYATKGLWGGEDGTTFLPPAYTNQSGDVSKFSEWCSGEWKREVIKRWASEQPGWHKRGVDCWINISWDERSRRRSPRSLWYQPRYVLLDERPTTVSGCLMAVERQGWPAPPRSRCKHCPNQTDKEWGELDAEEFEDACRMDEIARTYDPNIFLHKKCIPLRQVVLEPEKDPGLFSGGCQAGMCF